MTQRESQVCGSWKGYCTEARSLTSVAETGEAEKKRNYQKWKVNKSNKEGHETKAYFLKSPHTKKIDRPETANADPERSWLRGLDSDQNLRGKSPVCYPLHHLAKCPKRGKGRKWDHRRMRRPSRPTAKPTMGIARTRMVRGGFSTTISRTSVSQVTDWVKKVPISVRKEAIVVTVALKNNPFHNNHYLNGAHQNNVKRQIAE